MFEHRSVGLIHKIATNLDYVVRRDCKEISVKCSVMQLAQCQSVRSNWLALVARVGDDVRSIQQFQVLEPTQRTLMPIRAQDSFAKCVLVKTPSGERRL